MAPSRSQYYAELRALANEKRQFHRVVTAKLGLREMRGIYRAEGIKIDYWPYKLKKVRAAYLDVDGMPHVLMNRAIKPVEPKLFSLAHELKHHYADRELARSAPLGCQELASYKSAPVVEIGAEIFAAEFIFPEDEFNEWVATELPRGVSTPKQVVDLKRGCPAKISYTFLRKRLTRLGLASRSLFEGVRFKKLEEELYGRPFYLKRA